MNTAGIPPVDAAPATITAALAMHAGHIVPPLDFYPEVPGIRSLCLGRFRQAHLSSHAPAVASRPTAHTSERDDDGRSELGQGILDSDGLRSHDAPSD